MVARERVRKKDSGNARVGREALKEIVRDQNVNYEEKMQAVLKLNKRPRDESPCRCRSRCNICGRPRGVYRKFSLCRMCLRKTLMFGHMPGAKKASW